MDLDLARAGRHRHRREPGHRPLHRPGARGRGCRRRPRRPAARTARVGGRRRSRPSAPRPTSSTPTSPPPTAPRPRSPARSTGSARVDILVNNAGKGAPKPMLDLIDDDWRGEHRAQPDERGAALARVRAAHAGARAGVASSTSRRASPASPIPYFAPYAASKAALINFSKNLANAFSKHGVLTNCVVPGLIRSEAIDEAAEKSAAATGKTVEEVFAATLAQATDPRGPPRRARPTSPASWRCSCPIVRRGSRALLHVDGGIVRGDR